MKTSYFGSKKLSSNHFLVTISAYPCRFKKTDLFLGLLAPARTLLARLKAGEIDMEEYELEFRAQLDASGKKTIIAALESLKRMAGEKEPVLLCHCGLDVPCHRRMFAKWWQEQGQPLVQEL